MRLGGNSLGFILELTRKLTTFQFLGSAKQKSQDKHSWHMQLLYA